ncbi:46193_t:CDS:1, partial [Gigaspora margarita]
KKNEEFSAGIEGNKMILEGLTPLEIFKTNIEKISYTRSYKEMKEIYQDYYKDMNQKNSFERCWKSCNIFIYGTPRTGKSYLLDILFPNAYKKEAEDKKWWPGFNEHEEVIFDEFDGSFLKWQDLLNILDRRKYNVQIKGGHINYSPKIQAFTSNAPLCEQYIYAEEKKYITNKDGEQRLNRKYYSAIE